MSTTSRFGAGPVFLSGAVILLAELVSLACLFLMAKLESWHWLVDPGTTRPLTQAGLPYIVGGLGCAWFLFVLDAVITGRLFWGRGTGASVRKKGRIGFWIGIIFQAALALNLIGLGVEMKLNLLK